MENLHIHILFLSDIILSLIIIGFIMLIFYRRLQYQKTTNRIFTRLATKDMPLFFSAVHMYRFNFLPPNLTNRLNLLATYNLPKAMRLSQKYLQRFPHNRNLKLLLALMHLTSDNLSACRHLLNQIKISLFTPSRLKASYAYMQAATNLYNTDMDTSSRFCSKALKIFKRKHYAYEQGQCYLLLAHIYRLCGFHDIAFTMLKEAEKIYISLNIPPKIAEIQAYIGLLELNRENYAVACEYLKSAMQTCNAEKYPQLNSTIQNWLGLIYYLQADFTKSQKAYNLAIKLSSSDLVCALAHEMSARIFFRQDNFSQALKETDKAIELNQKNHQSAGLFETLYLKAEIYYTSGEYNESIKILTELINRKTSPKTTYYPANAHSLLGLIYLKQNELNKATTYFKQAIDLENSRDRAKGAAIDYNNLAEISLRQGEFQAAETYLIQACKLAETLQDDELKTYLQNKLAAHKSV